MQNIAVAAPSSTPQVSSASYRVSLILGGIAVGALWFILCRYLSSEWALNEQYSYGWFVPFFAAYLFWLRWEDRPAAFRTSDFGFRICGVIAVCALLLLLPLRLFEIGNPDWRPLGWLHAAIVVGLTLFLIWTAGGAAWLKHFAFPVCFIFVAVPWVSAIEMPVIQNLMRGVAAVAAETLNLFGIPAQLEGNLIRINGGLVGVNEACSGVRSLQTSLMIGLLFGELKRLPLVRRALLVAGAVAIALLANCLRALFLVWLATGRQVEAVTRWHDIAGYSIVLIVFVGTMLLASLLARKGQSRKAKVEDELSERGPDIRFLLPTSYFLLLLIWLVAVEIGVEFWYRAHERNLIAEKTWSVQFPANAPGFHETEIDEGVRRTLRFDHGRQAWWTVSAKPEGSESTSARAYAFFFRWNARGSSVVRARAHRPDICLPSVGWTLAADDGTRNYQVGNVSVPFRCNVFQRQGTSAVAYTYFCLQEDQRRPNEDRPDLRVTGGAQPDWSLRERTRVVREGVRNLGQQVLEIILLSPAPMDGATVEEEFARTLEALVRPEPDHS